MAIWQYSFKLIPRRSIKSGLKALQYDENGCLKDHVYWDKVPTSISFLRGIGQIMLRSNSWSKNLLIFGDLESTCLEIYSEGAYIKSVSFRIDFTSDFEKVLKRMIVFINSKNLVLFDERDNALASNYYVIKHLVEHSEQFYRYKKLTSVWGS